MAKGDGIHESSVGNSCSRRRRTSRWRQFAFCEPGPLATSSRIRTRATVLIHTTDGSCSGGTWADDTIMRTIKVHKNKDGSYRIREQDKGFFSNQCGGTIASPGNCPANTSAHGHNRPRRRRWHVQGLHHWQGHGVAPSTRRRPVGSRPGTQSCSFAAFFGRRPTFSCLSNSPKCKFKYDYHAKQDQNLLFRHWLDKGHGAGTSCRRRSGATSPTRSQRLNTKPKKSPPRRALLLVNASTSDPPAANSTRLSTRGMLR
jgi:hypothetical protein